MRRVLAVQLALLVVLVFGCARRPATTQMSAPAPVSGAGSVAGRSQSAPAGTPTTTRAGARAGETARVAPQGFRAVSSLKDINFDFDKYDIRPDAARILDSNAVWLKQNEGHLVLIEGHADERGTNEYNLALGDRRARAAMNYLIAQGIRANRITVISYGEERPLCAEHTEQCWARNRRAHFLVKAE